MRLLWLCNKPLKEIDVFRGRSGSSFGGWIDGMYDGLLAIDDSELCVVYPQREQSGLISGMVNEHLAFYGFATKEQSVARYYPENEDMFKSILVKFKPDIVHIFGTEYSHSLAMVKAFSNLERTVISIQGLVSVCAKHYFTGLPLSIVKRYTFRDLIKHDNIFLQRQVLETRGKYEVEALASVGHVIGRTDWDKACTSQINPKAEYHFCNETLRSEFYTHDRWTHGSCQQYSIFISQASSPIKGLHILLDAMPAVLARFPNTRIKIAGVDMIRTGTGILGKLKRGSYASYLREQICKYKLADRIEFLGVQNAEEMKHQYLSANAFVSTSSVENESNSVSEAKMLGTPVIASYVGGVTNRVTHGADGYLYQVDAPYMLAYYIGKVFENPTEAARMGANAHECAVRLHDIKNNAMELKHIYEKIGKTT